MRHSAISLMLASATLLVAQPAAAQGASDSTNAREQKTDVESLIGSPFTLRDEGDVKLPKAPIEHQGS